MDAERLTHALEARARRLALAGKKLPPADGGTCACGRAAHARGLCRRCYQRWWRTKQEEGAR